MEVKYEIQEIELWFKKDYQETLIRQFGRISISICYEEWNFFILESNNLLNKFN